MTSFDIYTVKESDSNYSHSIQVAVILVSALDLMRFIRNEQRILIAFFVLSIFLRSK